LLFREADHLRNRIANRSILSIRLTIRTQHWECALTQSGTNMPSQARKTIRMSARLDNDDFVDWMLVHANATIERRLRQRFDFSPVRIDYFGAGQ
jgi:hypothetical protein